MSNKLLGDAVWPLHNTTELTHYIYPGEFVFLEYEESVSGFIQHVGSGAIWSDFRLERCGRLMICEIEFP